MILRKSPENKVLPPVGVVLEHLKVTATRAPEEGVQWLHRKSKPLRVVERAGKDPAN